MSVQLQMQDTRNQRQEHIYSAFRQHIYYAGDIFFYVHYLLINFSLSFIFAESNARPKTINITALPTA